MERAVWRGRTLLGLVAYSLCLVGIAYACAATERGVSLPWVVFFAPFSGVSRLVGWDRSAPVVITMFVGAAALWPALWLCVRVSPGAHQKVVGEALLLIHYVSAAGLALVTPPHERELLGRPPLLSLAWLAAIVYATGQIFIWRQLLQQVPRGADTREVHLGAG
jgi:hypothetical protein